MGLWPAASFVKIVLQYNQLLVRAINIFRPALLCSLGSMNNQCVGVYVYFQHFFSV